MEATAAGDEGIAHDGGLVKLIVLLLVRDF